MITGSHLLPAARFRQVVCCQHVHGLIGHWSLHMAVPGARHDDSGFDDINNPERTINHVSFAVEYSGFCSR